MTMQYSLKMFDIEILERIFEPYNVMEWKNHLENLVIGWRIILTRRLISEI
jgi:hypothetical protein